MTEAKPPEPTAKAMPLGDAVSVCVKWVVAMNLAVLWIAVVIVCVVGAVIFVLIALTAGGMAVHEIGRQGQAQIQQNAEERAKREAMFGYPSWDAMIEAAVNGQVDYAKRRTDGMSLIGAVAAMADRQEIAAVADHGADLDTIDGRGLTPLAYAAMHNDAFAVSGLLARGADPNAGLESPLLHAINRGDQMMVDSLKAYGARLFSGESAKIAVAGPAQ